MFCKGCGNELKEGVAFCDKCGTPQNNNVATITTGNSINSTSKSTSKKLALIIGIIVAVIVVAIVLIIVLSNNDSDGNNSKGSNGGKSSSPTAYSGSDYCEEIPVVYYNLIDNAPIISHTDFVDTLNKVYDEIKDDYSIYAIDIFYDIANNAYGEPTYFATRGFGPVGALYSTSFDKVCIFLTTNSVYNGGDVVFAITPVDYSKITGPSGDTDDVSGTFTSTSFYDVSPSTTESMFGHNIISSDALHGDYSGLTYSEIADALGSEGLLTEFELFGKGYDNKLVAAWYCPEEDSVLVLVIDYDLKPSDYNTDYTPIDETEQNRTFYEKTTVYTESRESFSPKYYGYLIGNLH